MIEDENLVGPGTDLVVSLLVVALLLISVLTQLYSDTIKNYQKSKANEMQLITENEKVSKALEKLSLINDQLIESQSQHKILEGVDTIPVDDTLESEAELDEGHRQEIPKRTPKGKVIFRVYVEGNPGDPFFLMKPPETGKKIRASPLVIHTQLFEAQKRYQSNLYVAVIVPETFPVSELKKYRCEFWEYDYYQYFDKNYCKK